MIRIALTTAAAVVMAAAYCVTALLAITIMAGGCILWLAVPRMRGTRRTATIQRIE